MFQLSILCLTDTFLFNEYSCYVTADASRTKLHPQVSFQAFKSIFFSFSCVHTNIYDTALITQQIKISFKAQTDKI